MLSLFFDDQQETQTSMPFLPTPHRSPSCPRLPRRISWAVTYLFRPQQVCPLPTLELFQHLRKMKTQSLVRTELLAVIRPGRSQGPNPVPNTHSHIPRETCHRYRSCLATILRSTEMGSWLPQSVWEPCWDVRGLPNPDQERGSVEFS